MHSQNEHYFFQDQSTLSAAVKEADCDEEKFQQGGINNQSILNLTITITRHLDIKLTILPISF